MSRILGPESYRRVAWRNGLGSTLELAADATVPGGEWTWRLSIADVPAAAPFSSFPGVDRFLACLEGPGLRVERAGKSILIPSEGEAFAFAGEDTVSGDPLGPGVRDVNLMARRDRWLGSMALSRDRALTVEGEVVLVHAPVFAAAPRVELDGRAIRLTPGGTLIANGRVALTGSAVACALRSR